jgi:hypothetical protein
MELTQLPDWVESLGLTGVLVVGIWAFVRTSVIPKRVHDEIVAIYRAGAETDAATIKQLTADLTRMTTAMDKMMTSQQETLEAVRTLLPLPARRSE